MAEANLLDVAIILGSQSDLKIVEEAGVKEFLTELNVSWIMTIASAHRHPEQLKIYCKKIKADGVKVVICIVGLKPDLPSAVKAELPDIPVIGVPLIHKESGYVGTKGLLYMPPGLPVIVVGEGKHGIVQAGYATITMILGQKPPEFAAAFKRHLEKKAEKRPFEEICDSSD